MRILADENVPGPVVEALRDAGHDVAWVLEDAPGSGDARVLARMKQDRRILLTFNKGFGDSAVRSRVPKECGVVLVRLASPAPALLAQTIVRVIGSRDDWSGNLAVVEAGRVRMRGLARRGTRRRPGD